MAKNKLDLMSTQKLVSLFLLNEQKTINELKKQKTNITKTINQIIKRIQKNGRVIYLGCGTSGRLGILDAVECKPTFSTNRFLGIMSGGKSAIFQAKEGEEDNTKQVIIDLKKVKLSKDDVVIGISASGETPYTISGIKYAKKIRALTACISSNPKSTLAKISHCNISPEVGEEIISGSSRLKSGTAQKIILNMISSISMIKSSKVYNNLMIDVQPKNKKLVERAIRIISCICNIPLNKAKIFFKRARKNTKAAIVMYRRDCSLSHAIRLLQKSNFNLRKIIG